MKKLFDEGFHTIRYASRNWSGTWSDRAIEESVMRDAKSSGGLSHGTLRDLMHLWKRGSFSLSVRQNQRES